MRLINETALSEAMRDYFIKKIEESKYKVDIVDCHADIQAILRRQPTAYDSDKVVKQLKKTSYWTDPYYDEDGYSDDDSDEVVLLDKAIEIVKGGCDET